jgi:hypothetical protein
MFEPAYRVETDEETSEDFLARTEEPAPYDPDADGICEVCQ